MEKLAPALVPSRNELPPVPEPLKNCSRAELTLDPEASADAKVMQVLAWGKRQRSCADARLSFYEGVRESGGIPPK